MPLHPYAAVRYIRNSFIASAENLPLRLRPEPRAEEIPSVPPLPQAVQQANTPPVPPPAQPVNHRLDLDPVPDPVAPTAPGHFVKHTSKATLLLSGQEDGITMPLYMSGGTIEGILAVPRPANLLGLEVTVEGKMRLQEVAGSGSFQSDIIKDTLFAWDVEKHASFPTKINFRYTLPTHYMPRPSGERYRLPPTYEAHLTGLPGFDVAISYAITVTISRPRSKSNLWRGTSKLVVPFRYRELSRPMLAGPFPPSPTKTLSCPKTTFRFRLKPRRNDRESIGVQLFLPASQVCTLREPIPFYVTLSAGEDTLEPFRYYRPVPTSFHPLSSANSSSSSFQQQLMNLTGNHSSPVSLSLQRRTQIEVLAAGMPELAQEKTHMRATNALMQGIIHATTRTAQSITWSGAICLPPYVLDGGFVASGIKVTDWLTLSIVPPDPAQSDYMQFCESVPISLTTEAHDFYSAAVTISEWS